MGIEQLSALFTGLQVGGSIMSGLSANRQAKAQAQMLENQAAGEADAARAHAEKIRRAGRAQTGEARAALAGSGVQLGYGTSALIEHDITQNSEEDALTSILSGDREAASLRTQAKFTRAAGKSAMTGSLMSAVGYGLNGWKTVDDINRFRSKNKWTIGGG